MDARDEEGVVLARRRMAALAVAVIGLAAVVAFFAVVAVVVRSGQTVTPTVTGRYLDVAQERLEAAGLRLGKVTVMPTATSSNTVVSQDPPAHSSVKPGTRVAVVVSAPDE